MKRTKKIKQESIEDTLQRVQGIGPPDGWLDGDIEDACDDDAELAKEDMKGRVLLDQLRFLHEHGFDLGRLEELAQEAKDQLLG